MQKYLKPETIEARGIMKLVFLGTTTLEEARDLISIPEPTSHALALFVAAAGKEGAPIGRAALAFRQKVLVEFEKLVAMVSIRTSLPA